MELQSATFKINSYDSNVLSKLTSSLMIPTAKSNKRSDEIFFSICIFQFTLYILQFIALNQ